MAYYAKSALRLVLSSNSDYTSPVLDFGGAKELTTPTEVIDVTLAAAVAGVTVTTSTITTAPECYVINLDSSISVEVRYNSVAGGAGAGNYQRQNVAAGQWMKLTDLRPAENLFIAAASGTPICRAIVFGV